MPAVEVDIVPSSAARPVSASRASRRSARRSPTPPLPCRASATAPCPSRQRDRDQSPTQNDAQCINDLIDRGREGCLGSVALPALRTVHAVLPHTALQSLVSSSGVSRLPVGRMKGEQPMSREDRLDDHFESRLHDPVLDRRDPQRTGAPVAFGDLYPFDRTRSVAGCFRLS
jgi:hypothetical protein